MGTRSNNILAIHTGYPLPPEVAKYLGPALVDTNHDGSLYVWESNFTPMWARNGKGPNCVDDLLEEAAIQSFLGTIPAQDFYMKRAGEECDSRGEWELHSFRQYDEVIAVEQQYSAALEVVESSDSAIQPGQAGSGQYFIAVEVEAMGPMPDLCAALRKAFDHGAAGDFQVLVTTAPTYLVLFERDAINDRENVSRRIDASGSSPELAAMHQLAEELMHGDVGGFASPVVSVLQNGDAQCFDFGDGAIEALAEFARKKESAHPSGG